MKRKPSVVFSWTSPVIFLVFGGMLMLTCERLDLSSLLLLTTERIDNVGITECRASGSLVDLPDGGLEDHGFCWAIGADPTTADQIFSLGETDKTGAFSATISGLLPETEYILKSYGKAGQETVYGDTLRFRTDPGSIPLITTLELSQVAGDSARSGVRVNNSGGLSLLAIGICWDTLPEPILQDEYLSLMENISEGQDFYFTIKELACARTFYLRAYATNSAGTAYGAQKSFTTSDCSTGLPVLSTLDVSGITASEASCGGDISSDGGAAISARGVCWSISGVPDIYGMYKEEGSGTGSFVCKIEGLSCDINYYVRAYATNSAGTAYGEQKSFTTSDCPVGLPVVSTSVISGITETEASTGGDITSDGGAAIIARGVCWGTSVEPDITGMHSEDESETGIFVSNINGLSCEITYYVRAYATNSVGTAYGAQRSFTTSDCPDGIPEVTTASLSSITGTSAISGGDVTADGGDPVTACGVCWSTSPSPTISAEHTTDASGTGVFSSSITGLSCGSTYYVRAYATNAVGTAYGAEEELNTLACPATVPILSTTAISNISTSSAESGGNITDDGGATVTSRGVCWSTSPEPTTANGTTNNEIGVGFFSSVLTGLDCGTIYYVRAYAVNSVGTAYGAQETFTTSACPVIPTVSTSTVSSITESSAQGGGTVSSDGGSAVSERGICWGTNSNPTISDASVNDGIGTGGFTGAMTDLICLTTYYVRAYATNSVGTAYGTERSFSTSSCPASLSTVSTGSTITNITLTTATGSGNVTDDGGATVSERGICWSLSSNPTTAGSHASNGNGTGNFSVGITDLSCGTLYYIKAYAINSAGTAYGSLQSFTTSSCITLPTVTVGSVSDITQTTATAWGNVTGSGGGTVSERGICWNISGSPTTSDSYLSKGDGTGSFSVGMTGLSCGTIYYVRAYAINEAGIEYSSQQSFTSSSCVTIPTVSTIIPDLYSDGWIVAEGSVDSDGGSTVDERGICYSTSPGVSIANSPIVSGSGTGSFQATLSGLNSDDNYYIRAYATNSSGTAYGDEIMLRTNDPNAPTRQYFIEAENNDVYLDVSYPTHTFLGDTHRLTYVESSYCNVFLNETSYYSISRHDVEEINSDSYLVYCEGLNTFGDPGAFLSFGANNTSIVNYSESHITCKPGDNIAFTANASGQTFQLTSPDILINGTVDGWYSDIDLYNGNTKAVIEFSISSGASPGDYSFWLKSSLGTNSSHLRRLKITVQ